MEALAGLVLKRAGRTCTVGRSVGRSPDSVYEESKPVRVTSERLPVARVLDGAGDTAASMSPRSDSAGCVLGGIVYSARLSALWRDFNGAVLCFLWWGSPDFITDSGGQHRPCRYLPMLRRPQACPLLFDAI